MALNSKIREAAEIKNKFTAKDKERELARLYEKWDYDQKTFISEARSEGLADGEKIGLSKGEKIGMQNAAKKMLKENFDITIIAKITGLKQSEIKMLS